jgi:MFS family permease
VGVLGLEARQRITLAATVIGSALVFIDATIVIVALPTIERDLALGLTGQQWVFLSYSLTLAPLYIVAGTVGDRFGRRRTFAAGAAGFALASAVAGAAPTGEILIGARSP